MKTSARFFLVLTLVLLAGVALVVVSQARPGEASPTQGGAPSVVAYQGEVRVEGNPYNGTGYFKFAVVNADGDTSYWSNDGTSADGGEPAAAVPLVVSDGLFSVLLGNAQAGMTQPLTAGVFDEPDRSLRVWFGTSEGGSFEVLAPDTRMAAVPYALQAERVRGYAGVVVVAKSGGDYTSVQAAMDSITDAGAENAYLVWVAPGVYSEMVTMKPYVHLQGAGQEATVIHSTASSSTATPSQATLQLASDTSLRDLTVGNEGVGMYNVALLATTGTTGTLVADVTARAQGSGTENYAVYLSGSGTGVTLQQVSALAENGIYNASLRNSGGAAATLRGGSFTGRGGSWARGIDNWGSGTTLEATDVRVLAESGSTNYGLYNTDGAAATLGGGSFTGRGGSQARGIFSDSNGTTVEAANVTALGEGGSYENYGLYNYASAAAMLRGGSFTGRGGQEARGIFNQATDTTLEAVSVTALAEDGTASSYGLVNYSGAAATLRGGSFTGRGGPAARGIYNAGSGTTLEAESASALGESVTGNNYGLFNYLDAAAKLHGGSFTARGGTDARGISNSDNSAKLEAEGVTALGEGSSGANYGLHTYGNSSTADVTQSVLEGASSSVMCASGVITVSNSRLVDGTTGGVVTCVGVSWDTTFYPNSCP
jgi:hypothetical protein